MGRSHDNNGVDDKMILASDNTQHHCGSHQMQQPASDNAINLPVNSTMDYEDNASMGDAEEYLGWASQWLMKLPIFIVSVLNPWIYAYHNVDFKRCMKRYVRKILVGLKIIGQEAKANAGIFGTVKLDRDRSYATTAQIGNSGEGKAVACSLHYLSAAAALMQGQPNVNDANARTKASACTCAVGHRNTLSPPASPQASSDFLKNITLNLSSHQFNNSQSNLSR